MGVMLNHIDVFIKLRLKVTGKTIYFLRKNLKRRSTMQNKRLQIVDTAAQVFYRHGYRATGVELIAKSAGITKATLYHHFENKDALIEESLRHLSAFHRNAYQKAWSKRGLSAEGKLTVLFDEMHRFFKDAECYGCPFINAASEYTARKTAVRKICEAHYAFITEHLEQFSREARLSKPRLLAEQITTLIAGAYTSWFVAGLMKSAKSGKLAAEALIALHQPKR